MSYVRGSTVYVNIEGHLGGSLVDDYFQLPNSRFGKTKFFNCMVRFIRYRRYYWAKRAQCRCSLADCMKLVSKLESLLKDYRQGRIARILEKWGQKYEQICVHTHCK